MPKEEIIKRELIIENELGLHARPASMFVKLANNYISDIKVEKDGVSVNGKSIMGIMMLAASKGTKIKLIASGDDAAVACDKIAELLRSKFGEQ
ncbi:MAG: HPr family phosphocarrier protein [Candidatus Theseobacter exili]|nr:HPr family phosphocarrier protein [Candidatus Theseobacter exili]